MQDIYHVFSNLNIQSDMTKLQRVMTQFITTKVERGETSYDPSMLTKPMIYQDRDISRTREREREIKHIATGTNPQPRGWTTPSSSWWPSGWWRWPPVMISPSGRMPERAPDWFSVATEPCGGGTSDLGSPQGFLEYLTIYRAKRGYGRPTRWAQPTWARLGPQARPGGLCPPRGTPPRFFFGPPLVFWSIKNPQKVLRCLDSVWYWFPATSKNKQKTTTGTGHWDNRLVPKNDINLL